MVYCQHAGTAEEKRAGLNGIAKTVQVCAGLQSFISRCIALVGQKRVDLISCCKVDHALAADVELNRLGTNLHP
jgi:hypothetical protein